MKIFHFFGFPNKTIKNRLHRLQGLQFSIHADCSNFEMGYIWVTKGYRGEKSMETEVFKQKIYGPYSEAWKILKLIQFAGSSADNDEKWQMYMREIDRFDKKYGDNRFKDTLVKMLIEAGDDIAKMNKGGNV